MAKIKSPGVGRPSYQVKWPYNKFTFNQLLEHNGVNLKTGKGKNCSRLTLFKHLQGASKGTKSVIVKMDGTREPNSKRGLGRKASVFMRRDKFNALKTAKGSKVTVKIKAPAPADDYEARKAAIMAPAAPVASTPAPEPLIPTTAPVAPVQTAPEVTAPVIAELPSAPVQVTEPMALPEMAAA